MELVDERLANWTGYRMFQEALSHAGWEHLPTLRKYLPDVNGGMLPGSESQAALGELTWFERTWRGGAVACLVDSDTGAVLFESYDGVFILSGSENVDVGIDARGCFVRSRMDGTILFRSTSFEQRRRDGLTRLVDARTGAVCKLGRLVIADEGAAPARLHVATRYKTAHDYAYIMEPLKRLLAASIETGNPVRWE